MADNSNTTKRIALVVAALTGEELQATQNDAVKIYGILTDEDLGMCDLKESNLIKSCKSRRDFESAIFSTLRDWNSSNQFILYFSGHGEVRKNNYCLKFGEEFYPFKNLRNELETNGVNRAILILDTCHSGAAMGTKSEGDSTIIEEDDIPQGTAIITSSKKIEQSYEKKDGSNSVFTSLLCEGIKTGLDGTPTDDGRISVSDIVKYIHNKLSTAEFSNYHQTPNYDISKADKNIWITKNLSGQTKQQEKNSRDNVQNTDTIQSYDELKILYEQHAPKFHPCLGANIDDLDLDLLKEYSDKIEPGLYDPNKLEEVLTKLVLYSPIPYNGRKYLHKSAVLCFHKKPHKIYSSARSIFVLGNPGAPNFVREDIYGSLSHQFTQLVLKVENNIIKKSYIEKDGRRGDVADIDISVVREIISNAIVHRDYDAKGNVKVTVTKEAVEVSNPGSFPPDKPWDKFLESSFTISKPNDETIALYLTTLLAFEGIGRGFNIFKTYIKENGSDSLTCVEESGYVCVRLLRRQLPQEPINENNLSGQERKKLREAIISAYPRLSDLQIMVSEELGVDLNQIAGGENLSQIVFELIKWAEATGQLKQLIEVFHRSGNRRSQKILILCAIPHGLRLDKEVLEIKDAIRKANRRDSFDIRTKTAIRPQDIRRAIAEEKPQIVHFCGHGLADGSLVLEDDGGNEKAVTPSALATLFKLHADYVECVLINACHSIKAADAISQHINYAISINREVGDKAGIIFAQGFYDGLGYEDLDNQELYQRAFNEGLVAINLENLTEADIPVMKIKKI